jgi:hypothetical protein
MKLAEWIAEAKAREKAFNTYIELPDADSLPLHLIALLEEAIALGDAIGLGPDGYDRDVHEAWRAWLDREVE